VPAGSYQVTASGIVGNQSDDSTQSCSLTTDVTSGLQTGNVDTFHIPSVGSDRTSASESMTLSGTFTTTIDGTGIYVYCSTSDPSTSPDGNGQFNIEAVKVDAVN
jgi:hypothetical protein